MLARSMAALMVLVVPLAAGCGGGGGPSAAQIVSRSAAETAKVQSFHVVLSIQNVPASQTGMSLTYVNGDLAVPNALHANISGTLKGVPLNSELIVVGVRSYLKDPFSGTWHAVSVGTNPAGFFDPSTGVLAVINRATEVEKDGSENVGGVASYRLKAKVRADVLTPLLGNAPSGTLLPVELWIGKQDSLLRRVRLSGAVSPAEPKNALRTIELSAFNAPVRITPPAAQS